MRIIQNKKTLIHLVLVLSLTVSVPIALLSRTTFASDNNLADGITVDSTLDSADSNIGDGQCDDGAGNCTLRAAIQEANSNPDASIINFNIAPLDGSEKVISPTTNFNTINTEVVIDGYSQDDASPNTAVAPEPMNGTLRVRLDGSSLPTDSNGLSFDAGSSNSELKGLSFTNMPGFGVGIHNVSNFKISGNYIGLLTDGLTSAGNGYDNTLTTPINAGAGMYIGGSNNVDIGGTSPAERNIFSGNGGQGFSADTNNSTIRVYGNYVGVGKDSTTKLPNGNSGAALTGTSNAWIGGVSVGMSNVFSGNGGSGLSIGNDTGGATSDVIVQGNYMGTDWTGQIAVSNQSGLNVNKATSDIIIGGSGDAERNVMSGNASTGIGFNGSTDALVIGNYIGVAKDGVTPLANQQVGLNINASGVTAGGTSPQQANIIANSGNVNVLLMGTVAEPGVASTRLNRVIGNKIGIDKDDTPQTGSSPGVAILGNVDDNIIGGTTPAEANTIYSSTTAILSTDVTFGLVANPEGNSFLGNKIYGGPNNLGIDHCEDNTADFACDLLIGHTPNDVGDVDTGSNSLLNTPEITEIKQVGDKLNVTFDLDVIGSPTNQYRVEFFGNTSADNDGFGRGETLLGSATVSSGVAKTATLTLGSDADITSSVFSATTTVVDDTLSFGFGSTSEFGGLVQGANISYAPAPSTNSSNGETTVDSDDESSSSDGLANTGLNTNRLIAIVALLVVAAGFIIRTQKSTVKKLH